MLVQNICIYRDINFSLIPWRPLPRGAFSSSLSFLCRPRASPLTSEASRIGSRFLGLEGARMTKQEEDKAQARKKRKQQAFIYGNYKNYYGYRIDPKVSEDPRLALFKREWFEDKDCLDIGCNEGLVTIGIAKNFSCRRIHGVDIDGGLIEAAHWNLRRVVRTECPHSRLTNTSEPLISNGDNTMEHNISKSPGGDGVILSRDASHSEEDTLLERVSFGKENFVERLQGCKDQYDTVLCLSVTKWIQLNWGDDGLITLFTKIWRLLRPGGILLLEPQPWSSYKKNKSVSEIAKLNYKNILLTPNLFREILLDKIGFRSVVDVVDGLSGTVAGFDRPVFVFRK